MGGQYGVKSTEEALNVAKLALVAILTEVKKDGFQLTDLGAFLKSPEFEAAIGPAVQDVGNVPAEVGELDFRDDLELGRYVYACVADVLAALKTPA